MKVTAPVLVCIALGIALGGCAQNGSLAVKSSSPTPLSVDERVEFRPLGVAVFGDSITSWDPPYAGDPAQSWVTTARVAVPLVCGWAVPGATLGEMAAGAVPCSAFFLVVMGGTNDMYAGVSVEDRLAAIDAIVATVDAREVIIAAVAPFGFDWSAGTAWNTQLSEYATLRGWRFLDPWQGARSSEGAWTAGADRGDGIHPSPATATATGEVIRDMLLGWYAA